MLRRHPWAFAVAVGIVFGWVVAGGVTLLSDDTSSTAGGSGGGPASAEWLVGLGAGAVAALIVGIALQRASDGHLLGRPRRLAGGVGEESATANPAPQKDPEDTGRPGSKTTP
jgi:hypothetical protein